MSRRALITGIGGQDGSYLADILLSKGYAVSGLYRHSSVDNLKRVAHCRDRLDLHVGDVTDYSSVRRIVEHVEPDEVYHMADQDNVGDSVLAPVYQVDVTVKGVLHVLEAVGSLQGDYPAVQRRVFIPLSATMFSDWDPPQDESSPLNPMSHYACAKAAAWNLCKMYRDAGLFVACGIMFNHDSPRRGRNYLLQRIARDEHLWGDKSAVVDIGYAREYMEAAVAMLQQDEPDDYVIGTGSPWRIADLVTGDHGPVAISGNALIADSRKAETVLKFQPEFGAYDVLCEIREELKK